MPRLYWASGIFGIDCDGLAKFGQGSGVIALTAQGDAEHDVSRGKSRIAGDRGAKLRGGRIQFAELPFNHSKLEVHFCGGLQGHRALQLGFGIGEIVLLGINVGEEAMRSDIGRVDSHRREQFLQRGVRFMKLIQSGTQSVMGVGTIRFQLQGRFEFLDSLLRAPLCISAREPDRNALADRWARAPEPCGKRRWPRPRTWSGPVRWPAGGKFGPSAPRRARETYPKSERQRHLSNDSKIAMATVKPRFIGTA